MNSEAPDEPIIREMVIDGKPSFEIERRTHGADSELFSGRTNITNAGGETGADGFFENAVNHRS